MRRYHRYRFVWEADIGEELPCKREKGNSQDPFAYGRERLDMYQVRFPLFVPCFFAEGEKFGPVGFAITKAEFTRSKYRRSAITSE